MIPESLSPIANHLWQSTLFAGIAGLLTLALRKNSARVRYWIWVAASVKFLIPFSVLITIGDRFEWRTAPEIAPNVSVVVEQVSQPFTAAAVTAMPAPRRGRRRADRAVALCNDRQEILVPIQDGSPSSFFKHRQGLCEQT